MLLIQWRSIQLALASEESAVFQNQMLLSGVAVGLDRCVIRWSKAKIFDAVGKLSLHRDAELNRDFG